jgi:hypothetical protein
MPATASVMRSSIPPTVEVGYYPIRNKASIEKRNGPRDAAVLKEQKTWQR